MSDAKVALVTGASSGIGADTARLLHSRVFIVYAVARRLEPMRELAESGVRVFGMDVTDDASVTAGIEKILAETGRIDVLVNNAGYGSFGSVEDVPLDEARRQFEVNVFGLARLIQLTVPHMRALGSGHIPVIMPVCRVGPIPSGCDWSARRQREESRCGTRRRSAPGAAR